MCYSFHIFGAGKWRPRTRTTHTCPCGRGPLRIRPYFRYFCLVNAWLIYFRTIALCLLCYALHVLSLLSTDACKSWACDNSILLYSYVHYFPPTIIIQTPLILHIGDTSIIVVAAFPKTSRSVKFPLPCLFAFCSAIIAITVKSRTLCTVPCH
ncbi:hypothetical protein BDF19DRAFT_446552 [Syncephalis fuscata]|nr:hypothetical protein BDF19DRAFT_446552 [Syncephalis fuscata]